MKLFQYYSAVKFTWNNHFINKIIIGKFWSFCEQCTLLRNQINKALIQQNHMMEI